MKVLFIYPNRLGDMTGGAAEAKKVLRALQALEKDGVVLSTLTLDSEEVSKSKWMDMASRCTLHSSYFYIVWQRIRKKYLVGVYDMVVLSSSRLGFVVKDFKRQYPKTAVMTFWHNVEYDYAATAFSEGNILSRKLMRLIEQTGVLRDERESVDYSDVNVYITKEDRERSRTLYGECHASYVIPICTSNTIHGDVKDSQNKTYFIFTGALDYHANRSGLRWFLEEVWPSFAEREDVRLIVAGSAGEKTDLGFVLKAPNCHLVKNYKTMASFLPSNAVFIAPIRSSAGMKTKCAEALSFGLPIIGTKESFIGYEEALKDERSHGILVQADSEQAFAEAMNAMVDKGADWSRATAVGLWQEYYSDDRAYKEIGEIVFGKIRSFKES